MARLLILLFALAQDRVRYSKTWQGKYYNALGYFFSVYCVYKLVMVGVGLFDEAILGRCLFYAPLSAPPTQVRDQHYIQPHR